MGLSSAECILRELTAMLLRLETSPKRQTYRARPNSECGRNIEQRQILGRAQGRAVGEVIDECGDVQVRKFHTRPQITHRVVSKLQALRIEIRIGGADILTAEADVPLVTENGELRFGVQRPL